MFVHLKVNDRSSFGVALYNNRDIGRLQTGDVMKYFIKHFVVLLFFASSAIAASKSDSCALNVANIAWYHQGTARAVEDLVEQAGLQTNPDIDRIRNEIRGAKSILEIGSGSGRVIRAVRSLNPSASLVGLEPAASLFVDLKAYFSGDRQTQIIRKRIQDYARWNLKKFDLVLWMFSGYADLSLSEKRNALKMTARLMSKHGRLIIDLAAGKSSNATAEQDRLSIIRRPYGDYRGILPTDHELKEDCEAECLEVESTQRYNVVKANGEIRERITYTIRKGQKIVDLPTSGIWP